MNNGYNLLGLAQYIHATYTWIVSNPKKIAINPEWVAAYNGMMAEVTDEIFVHHNIVTGKSQLPVMPAQYYIHGLYSVRSPRDRAILSDRDDIIYQVDSSLDQEPDVFIASVGVLGQGSGVYAGSHIPKDTPLGCYQGDYHDHDDDSDDQNMFAFSIDGAKIDGTTARGWSAYMNHAFSGCSNVRSGWQRDDDDVVRIYFYAASDINVNDQLLYNYGPNYFCNLDVKPVYLNRHSHWYSMEEAFYSHKNEYDQKEFCKLSDDAMQAFKLAPGSYLVVTKLVSIMLDNQLYMVGENDFQQPDLPCYSYDSAKQCFVPASQQQLLTALMLACYVGNYPVVLKLLEEGADVNTQCLHSGRFALLFAVIGLADKDIKFKIIQELLNYNACLLANDEDRHNVLYYCMINNDVALARYFLNYGGGHYRCKLIEGLVEDVDYVSHCKADPEKADMLVLLKKSTPKSLLKTHEGKLHDDLVKLLKEKTRSKHQALMKHGLLANKAATEQPAGARRSLRLRGKSAGPS